MEFWRHLIQTKRADRRLAEDALAQVYALHSLPPPTTIWVDAPIEVMKAIYDGRARFRWGRLMRFHLARLGEPLSDLRSAGDGDSIFANFAALIAARLVESRLGFMPMSEIVAINNHMLDFARAALHRGGAYLDVIEQVPLVYAYQNYAICCERPTSLSMSASHQFHNRERKAAIAYGDWEVHADRNTYIAQSWARDVDFCGPLANHLFYLISRTFDHSVHNFVMERFGRANYIKSAWMIDRGQSSIIHTDQFGKLWEVCPPLSASRSFQKQRFVEVRNSTARNGEHEIHFIRVAPECRSARDAVAWTFGMTGEEYERDLVAEA